MIISQIFGQTDKDGIIYRKMRHYCANHKKQSKKSHDRGIFLFRGYRKSFSSRQSISTTGQKNGNATCDGVVFPSHRAPPRRNLRRVGGAWGGGPTKLVAGVNKTHAFCVILSVTKNPGN